MQPRGVCIQMATESEERKSPSQQTRSRISTKPKVLVRSHAMREETSPPRAPTPTPENSHCIQLIPSLTNASSPCISPQNGKPVVVLSPTLSRGSSPCHTPTCPSPTSTLTLIPSPSSRNSPQNFCCNDGSLNTTDRLQAEDEQGNKVNRQIDKETTRTEIIIEETSHLNRKKSDRFNCDCSSVNCIKCIKSQERNFNNNLSNNNNNVLGGSNMLSVSRANMKNKLRQHSSGQSSFDGSLNNSPCLSRDSSSEQYTDTTGIDLDLFFPETLNKNIKDRVFLLRIEKELVEFAKDTVKTHYKFPPMSSYQRMLVHRCAAYFGMDHNIESSGKCVVVNKTKNTRIPDVEFRQHIKGDFVFCEEVEPQKLILKRDLNRVEDYNFKSPDRQHSFESRRSKSFEEREEEYEKVRRRIFERELHQGGSIDAFTWSNYGISSIESDGSGRLRVHLPNHHYRHPGRLLKVQSEETNEALRPCVAKSYSFGGYGGVSVLAREDSVLSTHSASARILPKQDSATSSVSWRLSPSSSGYKSQSQRSESVTPSPTSTPYDSTGGDSTEKQLVWAVTDIHSVPKGSIIINPQTGGPYKNEDGTIYHYDPMNPPAGFSVDQVVKPTQSPQKVPLSPKKSIKERPPSPKKRTKGSPCKKSNFTNSSTSPSLPYTPPPSIQNRVNCHYVPSSDSVPQQFSIYTNPFGSVPQQEPPSVPYFQSPCVVYAPYTVPVTPHYEGRLETPLQGDIPPPGGYYVNLTDGTQPVTYQPPPTFWNQQPVTYYQNAQPPPNSLPPSHHRFSFPLTGQPGYIPTSYQSNFLPHANQTPQNQELLPVYSQQPVQVMYPQGQPGQQTPVMYPNPGPVLYTQNPLYPNPVYSSTTAMPPQNIPHYPQSTSTPNSCSSSVSNNAYCRQIGEMPLQTVPVSSFNHVAQSMGQLNLNAGQMSVNSSSHQNYTQHQKHQQQQQQQQPQKSYTPKGGSKFNGGKNFTNCSSQNSTGTSSPATTIATGYPGNMSGGNMYRPATDTPPLHNVPLGYGPNYVQPVLCRQNSTGTNRSSRSPTPASDICNIDKQRMSLPPTVYQGMPYVFQVDNRMMDGRNPVNNYRQPAIRQQQIINNQGTDYNNFNRMHKNRKPRGNKPNGLPPSGK